MEFLIMATALFGLFTILVQFGINLHAQRVAEAAAREGAVEAARFDGTEGAGSRTAKEYVTEAIKAAYPLGRGHGPVHHFYKWWER